MELIHRRYFLLLFLLTSIHLLSAQDRNEEVIIIRRLVAPLSDDSLRLRYDSNQHYTFTQLIRLAIIGRSDGVAYAKAALDRSMQSKNPIEQGLAYTATAVHTSNFETIDTCTNKAIAIFRGKKLNNLALLSQLYGAGSQLHLSRNYVKTYSALNQFLTDYQIKDDSLSLSMAWNLLGEIYRNIINNGKALDCYRQSAAYAIQKGKINNASPFINMGTIYKNIGYYDSAFYYYDLILASDTARTSTKYAYIANRKAQVYLLLKNFVESEKYANESLRLYEKLNSADGKILVLSTLTQLHFALSDYNDCIATGEKAIKLALQQEFFPQELMESCKILVTVFERKKDFEKALYYQETYDDMFAQLFGPDVNLKMLNEQLELEQRNQDLERSLLLEDQKRTEQTAKTQRQFLLFVLVAFVLSIITILLLFTKNRTIKKLNYDLHDRQDEILAQTEKLKATNEEIEAINMNLESLVKERSQKIIEQNKRLTDFAYFNAHKVRGPLARILGLISVMELDLMKETVPYANMLKQAGKDLDESIHEINTILEKDTPTQSEE